MVYNQEEDVVSLFDFLNIEDRGAEEEIADAVAEEFAKEVEAAQRLGIMRNFADYSAGSIAPCSVNGRALTNEKMVNVPGLFTWEGDRPEGLIAELKVRRVRTRLQASMGVGKTTRLAPMLADELSARVLLVSLNAHALRQTSEYVRTMGLGKYRRSWGKERASRVNCMTYHDFNSHMSGGKPAFLFQSFEIIIFDEAFEATAPVFCAMRAFAAYATANVSLILCSATISREVGTGGPAALAGSFVDRQDASLAQMIETRKLVTDYLVDRTFVVLPTDAEVAEAEEHYGDYGVTVLRLDSASSYEEFTAALAELNGDGVVPRVLVMHYRWAIGFNIGVEYGVIRPYRSAWVAGQGGWQERQFLMTQELVAQAKSRSGRGIVSGSSGMVLGRERAPAVQLYESERLEAFVCLYSMGIRPGKHEQWDEARTLFPEDLPAITAHTLLKINLPVAIAVKFLGPDGLVAGKYARALSMFTQCENYLSLPVRNYPLATTRGL